ncbi:uncharacterized protein [Lolium perenne]|uniref:uncharacterized protein n=1 Tax=Lolium perenne TaxID=4522 RepID=UPI0021F6184A|nr:uncharacterized protein LOC127331531 [Lolium perenne]
MEHLARYPDSRTRVYHLMAEGMAFKVTVALRARRRAAVLQISVASETFVFQICYADEVTQVLNEFLQDGNIRFGVAAISNDAKMLRPYGVHITYAYDLVKILPNPTNKPTPSLYDLANYTIETNLEKKRKYKKMDIAAQEKEDKLIFGWANFSLSYEQVHYAPLDARMGFEIARSHWMLVGYNNHVDRLNI